jgi:hypothetical protein
VVHEEWFEAVKIAKIAAQSTIVDCKLGPPAWTNTIKRKKRNPKIRSNSPQRFLVGIGSALEKEPTRIPTPLHARDLSNEQQHTHIQQLSNVNPSQTQPLAKYPLKPLTLATTFSGRQRQRTRKNTNPHTKTTARS